MRESIASLMKERNKLRDDKSGGSNKYLITTLENELNTLQIRFDVIERQRDQLRRVLSEAETGKLETVTKNQRNTIKTLRDRISQLIKEKNTLRWQQDNLISEESQSEQKRLRKAIDGQKGSIKILRTEIKKLQIENINFQNKYQNLYTENNATKIDFDKLDRNHKQLLQILKQKVMKIYKD